MLDVWSLIMLIMLDYPSPKILENNQKNSKMFWGLLKNVLECSVRRTSCRTYKISMGMKIQQESIDLCACGSLGCRRSQLRECVFWSSTLSTSWPFKKEQKNALDPKKKKPSRLWLWALTLPTLGSRNCWHQTTISACALIKSIFWNRLVGKSFPTAMSLS